MEKVLVLLLLLAIAFHTNTALIPILTGQLSECFPNWKQEEMFRTKDLSKGADLSLDALVTKLGNTLRHSPISRSQDNGVICLQSSACKGGCCKKYPGFRLYRCADKAAENEECSIKNFVGISKCPCASGLLCKSGVCQTAAEQ